MVKGWCLAVIYTKIHNGPLCKKVPCVLQVTMCAIINELWGSDNPESVFCVMITNKHSFSGANGCCFHFIKMYLNMMFEFNVKYHPNESWGIENGTLHSVLHTLQWHSSLMVFSVLFYNMKCGVKNKTEAVKDWLCLTFLVHLYVGNWGVLNICDIMAFVVAWIWRTNWKQQEWGIKYVL